MVIRVVCSMQRPQRACGVRRRWEGVHVCRLLLTWALPGRPLLGGRDMVARVQDEYGKLDILVNK